ncbi:MAG: non-canonical purine NTP pyrophosphatase [Bacteroidota bacterium]
MYSISRAWPDGHTETFQGEVHGDLVWPLQGTSGFGYDPMFVPQGCEITFGEMAPDKKHEMSHRHHAFQQLVAACFDT